MANDSSGSGEIFISYKSERRAAAEHLADTLQRHGYSVWFDYQLVKGKDFARQIDTRIRAAKALIVLWCTRSVHSEWVSEEVDLAKALGILVPAKIEDCELPVGNRLKDYIDLRHWDGSPRSHQLDPLLEAIASKVGRDPQPNYRALQEYEATWRRFGAPSLRAFAFDQPLEASMGARPLPEHSGSSESARAAMGIDQRMRAQGRILIEATYAYNSTGNWFKPGAGKDEWFKDHGQGPEMVVVPAGSFVMGSPANEPEREGRAESQGKGWRKGSESPQHAVTIARPFAVGRHAVTWGQFAAFVNSTGYKKESWRVPDFAQDDSHPVVCVSWEEAKTYAAWLAQVTGRPYRLLTEAEWEYCCRAGTSTPFWWGSSITTPQANYDGRSVYKGGGSEGEYRKATVPVGTFAANPWGLYQVHGNVWEWCEDLWHDTYNNSAPSDSSAWLQGGDASRRVVRGGCWGNNPRFLRSAMRVGNPASVRDSFGLRDGYLGFRVGRTLTP